MLLPVKVSFGDGISTRDWCNAIVFFTSTRIISRRVFVTRASYYGLCTWINDGGVISVGACSGGYFAGNWYYFEWHPRSGGSCIGTAYGSCAQRKSSHANWCRARVYSCHLVKDCIILTMVGCSLGLAYANSKRETVTKEEEGGVIYELKKVLQDNRPSATPEVDCALIFAICCVSPKTLYCIAGKRLGWHGVGFYLCGDWRSRDCRRHPRDPHGQVGHRTRRTQHALSRARHFTHLPRSVDY